MSSGCKHWDVKMDAYNKPDSAEEEPHIDDVVRAWNSAIQCEGIGGSRAETMQELIAIRNRKTTWFGKYENDMRFAIDNYIQAKTRSPGDIPKPTMEKP